MLRRAVELVRLAVVTEAAFLRYATWGWHTDPEPAAAASMTFLSTDIDYI